MNNSLDNFVYVFGNSVLPAPGGPSKQIANISWPGLIPELLNNAKCLLPSLTQSSDISTVLINNFVSSVEDNINKQTTDSIKSINSNLDIASINLIERKIIDALKNIKGELPLKGLVERINYYQELLEKLNTSLVSNNSKKRELSLNRKLM